ncbi:ATP synthase gamma chain [Bacteroidia bacterium]|nr:ATP synthase gamma chain [Bacteroidia bacterium]
MASLKEIKGRIASVKSTQKITSAMKMVASAKLRKAQYKIDSFLPYQYKLNEMLHSFLSSITDFDSNLAEVREVKRVAIVVLSSNSSLCGAFNSNIVKLLKETLNKYKDLGCNNVEIYPIGKKIEEQVRKMTLPFKVMGSYTELMDKPNFEGAKQISEELINDFLHHKIDKVELLYNHFKNTSIQIPTAEQYLPINLTEEKPVVSTIQTDYLIEPDKETVLQLLIPKSLHSKVYAVLLDSAAAEQGARVVAMQIATDNAGDILDELTIQYNKQRQQSITSELLDIIGGSEAQK